MMSFTTVLLRLEYNHFMTRSIFAYVALIMSSFDVSDSYASAVPCELDRADAHTYTHAIASRSTADRD
jgi:hypothetical protein